MSKRPVYVISSDDESDDEGIQLVAYKKSKSSSPIKKQDNSALTKPSQSTTSSSSSGGSSIELKYNGNEIYFNKMTNDSTQSRNLITLKEILNIEKAKSLFLSSYCLDFEFLKTVIPFTKCELPITLSKHWDQKEEKKGRKMLQIGTCPVCICHPPLLGAYSNMHAKVFMIEFNDFIRIVVSSANLTEFDWNFFKQCIWIQDFPKKGVNFTSSPFENTLVEFWTKLTDGIPGNFLRKYDYSNAKGELIPSVPGYHTTDKEKFGHLAIKKSIERMNFTKTEISSLKDSPLYYQMSSIGSMNNDWIKELSNSFYLKDSKDFNIVFPSLETVSTSHFGLRCGGMIHLKSKTFETSTFPKHLMTHYLPNHGNHLSHSKILFHLSSLKNGYVFIGSHNLSQPALGKLQKNASQLYISNYELGIIFKINNLHDNYESKEAPEGFDQINNENLDKYCKLNLPFKIPTKRMDFKNDSPFILETVQDLLD